VAQTVTSAGRPNLRFNDVINVMQRLGHLMNLPSDWCYHLVIGLPNTRKYQDKPSSKMIHNRRTS
jgi:hypothetical protein